MFPYVTIGMRSFPMYGLMALIGAILAGIYAYAAGEKRQLRPVDMIEVLFAGAVGVVGGGHLLYALTVLPYWSELSLGEILGGSVFYGGLLGGLLTGYLWIRIRKYPLGPMAEIFACCIPLFHAVARVGCFFAGCCYGIPCAFGFTMHASLSPLADGVSRFPIALLEAAGELCLFLYLHHKRVLRKKEGLRSSETGGVVTFKEGSLLHEYLILYAVLRFLDEFLRGDVYRGIWGWFSTSQWISLLILTVYLIRALRSILMKKEPDSSAGRI